MDLMKRSLKGKLTKEEKKMLGSNGVSFFCFNIGLKLVWIAGVYGILAAGVDGKEILKKIGLEKKFDFSEGATKLVIALAICELLKPVRWVVALWAYAGIRRVLIRRGFKL